MKYFLHFIGKQFYSTRGKFIREAQKYGVSRRISLQDLKQMNFGDRILLVMKEGIQKILFGFFTIETISGLSRETIQILANLYETDKLVEGGFKIERNCGTYIQGDLYGIDASIPDIVRIIENSRDKKNVLMIGGGFEPFPILINLKDIPHRMGFRLFDWEEFLKAEMKYSRREKIPYVEGLFYVKEQKESQVRIGGYLQEILDYTKKKPIKPSMMLL